MAHRDEKVISLIGKLSAEFIGREATPASLITVTSVSLSSKGNLATIFVTVLPQQKEDAAIDFLKRNLSEMREYIMTHAKMGRMPYLSVAIDKGEKNRQHIDEISQEV